MASVSVIRKVRRISTVGFLAREEGQTMAEYAVVLAVITPLLVAILGLLGTSVSNKITQVAELIVF